MRREDDFDDRRKHLKELSDKELYDRFWELTEKIVEPLVELAYYNTSPSIERSVLLRMGFSSLEADNIVKQGIKYNLIGKGMGNVVLTYSKIINEDYLAAGKKLADEIGWDKVIDKMRGDNYVK